MTVRIVCTDRGQHPQRYIRRDWRRELEDTLAATPPELSAAGTARRPDGGITFVFDCRTCGRHVELRDDTWYALLADLQDAGAARLDISHLPI